MSTLLPTEVSEKKGTWFAVLSGLCYGLLGVFGVGLINSGLSPFNVSFWRFLSASLVLSLVFLARPTSTHKNFRDYLLVFLVGGVFFSTCGTLFFLASRYVSTGQSMVVFFVYPLLVMFLNWIFLKEPLKPVYFLSFFLILIGLILLVDIGEVRLDFFGIGLSLLSASSYAFYVFFTKKLTALPAITSTLVVLLGCTVSCGLMALFDGSLVVPSTLNQWLYVFGLGIICSALPILFLFEALKHISAEKASLLSVLEPVFVVIFGVLLLDETLEAKSIVGIILILAGATSVSVRWRSLLLVRPG